MQLAATKTAISVERRKAMATKILQINFRVKSSIPEYRSLCDSVAEAFAGVPGLRWKIWILNDRENAAGGIYLFESERALSDFVSGPLAAQVKSHPALADFSAKVFDAMEEVTAITHGPVAAAAAAAR
jgi:putative monooxygenase ydhR